MDDHIERTELIKSFTITTNVQVYFCDRRSPWQRGSNENTNGVLRQHFPRETDLARFSQAYLNRIALRLNQRPRKTLGFEALPIDDAIAVDTTYAREAPPPIGHPPVVTPRAWHCVGPLPAWRKPPKASVV